MRWAALWVLLAFFVPMEAVSLPDAEQTRRRALVFAELEGPMDDWGGRARISNLIPEIEADFTLKKENDVDDNYRETLSPDDQGDLYSKTLQTTTGRDFKHHWAGRIRIRLSPKRLVFDPDELRARALALNLEERRERLLRQVTDLFMEWTRLRTSHSNHADEERALRHAESITESHLDALTGGWFHTQIRGKQ